MKSRAIVHPAEEGGCWAEVPALPGCMTQGGTREELLRNLRKAVEGWLAAGVEREGEQEIIEMA